LGVRYNQNWIFTTYFKLSKTLKNALLKKCKEQISSTILFLENHLKDLSSGAQNDSKSSAGDKHETARAMMQIEQEKVGKQLKENQLQLAELNSAV
jgi:hypothetical protein